VEATERITRILAEIVVTDFLMLPMFPDPLPAWVLWFCEGVAHRYWYHIMNPDDPLLFFCVLAPEDRRKDAPSVAMAGVQFDDASPAAKGSATTESLTESPGNAKKANDDDTWGPKSKTKRKKAKREKKGFQRFSAGTGDCLRKISSKLPSTIESCK
jgi:hypothetical protein